MHQTASYALASLRTLAATGDTTSYTPIAIAAAVGIAIVVVAVIMFKKK